MQNSLPRTVTVLGRGPQLLPALVVIAALAGCLGGLPSALQTNSRVNGTTAASPLASDGLGTRFPAATIVSTNVTSLFLAPSLIGKGGGIESSVAVGPNDVVLACAHGEFSKPSPVWASTDDGLSFHEVTDPGNKVVSGDCDTAVAPDGTWYVTYDTVASATVAVSSDQGKTWKDTFVDAIPAPIVDRPWLFATPSRVFLAYEADEGGINCEGTGQVFACADAAAVFVATSTDHGATWTTQRAALASATPLTCFLGPPTGDSSGMHVFVPVSCWASEGNGPVSIDILESTDGGSTWSTQTIAQIPQGVASWPRASYASDGVLYAAYGAGPADNASVELVTSLDLGKTWTKPMAVAANQRFDSLAAPSIDAQSGGHVFLSWLENNLPAGGREAAQPTSPLSPAPPEEWGVWSARLLVEGGVVHVAYSGTSVPSAPRPESLEFLTARQDSRGTGLAVFVAEDGANACEEGPLVGTPARSNTACVELLKEKTPGGAG
jgi:hypothetical protein